MSELNDLAGIAVIGMSGRFPGSRNLDEFWHNLVNGVEGISVFSDEELLEAGVNPSLLRHPNYIKAAPVIEDTDLFDASFFGISPVEAEMMDPQHRIFLEVAWEALEHAGYNPETYDGEIGVYAGSSISTYLLTHLQELSQQSSHVSGIHLTLGNDKDYLCTRVSYKLNLKGPSVSVQTACSTSLTAICMACDSLLDHQCKIALAGGVTVRVPQKVGYFYEPGSILSPDGHCRAFDTGAAGTVFGNGVGVVVLKRLQDAVADGDDIHAVIKGAAVNNDGSLKVGFTAPGVDGQAKVIATAQAMAETPPETITYIEAHGTATQLGDPIEIAALTRAFRAGTQRKNFCSVGSVKTNVGHLEAAAGVAGLIKTVLALKHKMLPPSLHYQQPNAQMDLDQGPFYINTKLSEWKTNGFPHRAGVSSFGMGGTNAHVVMEEAPAPAPVVNEIERPEHLLTLSARSEKALRELVQRYEAFLGSQPEAPLADICYTAGVGRKHFSHRLAVRAESVGQLRERLGAYGAGGETDGVMSGVVSNQSPPPVAFLFTGQGSQYPGMGRHLFLSQPAFRRSLELCDQLLAPHLDRPLLSLLFSAEPADASLLDQTAYTQPALFALEYSLAQLWLSWGVRPVALLGHSLGEYVAACLAGVFGLDEALGLVAARGRLMQHLPAHGAMASVAAEAGEVAAALVPWRGAVVVAALNGPRQTVIAGGAEAVAAACQALSERGVRARPLRVSQAFHSPLVEPMLAEFAALAARVSYRVPQVPVISNLSGAVGGEELATPEYWVRQAREPVRFGAGVAALAGLGVGVCLEVGPQPVLTRLAGESPAARAAGVEYVHSLERGRGEWEQMLSALAGLYVRGVEIDWAGYEGGYERRRVALPTYPFQRQRYWVGAGRGGAGRRIRVAAPGAAAEHPLLGSRLAEAGAEGARFEHGLSSEQPAYLAEHRVFGAAVVPAAAYLEMMQAAVGLHSRSRVVELAGASFRRTLVLAEGEEQRLQVVVKPQEGGGYEARVYSASGEEAAPSWVLHASAAARPVAPGQSAEEVDLGALQARCPAEVSVAQLYDLYQRRGLDYGAAFRPVESLWRGEGEALALLRLPQNLEPEAEHYRLHPVLLDGAFQTLGGIFGGAEGEAEQTFLPVGLQRLQLYEEPGPVLWCHARVRGGEGGEPLSAELRLISPEGRLVAAAEGLQSRRASRAAVLQQAQEPIENWLYEVAWRPQEITPQPGPGTRGRWLILADGVGVGEELSRRLKAQGESVKVARVGREWAQLSAEECELDPDSATDYQRLLQWVREGDAGLRGVVHLWGLGEAEPQEGAELSGAEMGRRVERACRSTLQLLQAMTQAGLAQAPRLWLVSRGAQTVGGPAHAAGVAQASLWGLGKVIALEHPELKSTLVDLGAEPDEDQGASLFAELWAGYEEREIAYRDAQRYVARLARYGQGGTGAKLRVPTQGPYELSPAAGGELSGLHFRQTQRRPPGPGEVEIEARAWSLNFKDVLNAMGLYPGDAGALGSECAGVVVGVGPDVTGVALGDEVAVMMPGSFRSHLTVEAWQAAPKPPGLSLEEAASLPVAFLTAAYGLRRLARLAAGERVLIHSAAGGVGMAAIQIAHLAGAEVLATSSPGKWETVRGLGVERVFNSRTLEFGDEVLEATDGRGVEVVLNSLTGEAIERSLAALAPHGRFVEIGRRGIWGADEVAALRPDAAYHVLDLGEALTNDRAALLEVFRELFAEFAAGRLKSLPLTLYAAEEAVEAFRHMQQGKHVGKIVLTLPQAGAAEAPATGVRLDAEASYLVTGGLGGLGLEVAGWMAERGARHLVLVGRRVEGAAQREEVRALVARGVRVRVVGADLSRRAEVRRVIEETSGWGPPLRGVVHAAGVTDDGVLARQSWERIEGVLGGKALGAWHLHQETAGLGLEFFVLFASAAGVLGNGGQGGYAAANAFLDALAQYRRGEGLPGLSIDWGAWSEVGMAARRHLDEHLGANEVINPRQGIQILEQLLSQPAAQVTVMPVNWANYLGQFPPNGGPPFFSELAREVKKQSEGNEQALLLRRQLQESPPAERRELLVDYLRELISNLLRLGPSQRPEPSHSLSELGLDSLTGIQLKNRLRAELGADVSIEEFIESPSIARLADLLLDQLAAGQTVEVEGATLPPLVRVTGDGHRPLSFAQQRLWYLEQLESDVRFYNLSFGSHIKGQLDVSVVGRALDEIVRRHETLRTTFPLVDGQPVQVIAREGSLELPVIDLRHLSGAEREAETQRLATAEALRPFDLARGPLVRAVLLRLGDGEYLLGVTMHHIIADGWSLGVFISEFAALYEAFTAGRPSPLAELPIQYADFAVWQEQWLRGEMLDAELRYWRQQLGGKLTALELPTDRPRPAVQTFRGRAENSTFPKELTERLNALSRQEGATLFMTLLAAFKALIYRYTGQSDILMGSLVANRMRPEVEELIGFFANMLSLRTEVSGDLTFRELLGRVREVTTGAYAHQDLPFERLVAELQPERNLNRNPLVQVVFVLQKGAFLPAAELPGVTLKSFWNVNDGAVRFDLEVHLMEYEDGLGGHFVYNTDLFDAATIRRMTGHFQTLLEEIVADPDQRIATLPYLTAAERRQLLAMPDEAGAVSREAAPPVDELSDEEVSALLDELLTKENEQ